MIPPEVLAEARAKVATSGVDRSLGYMGAAVILFMWIVILMGVLYLIKFPSN
jgi:hypothetical protein